MFDFQPENKKLVAGSNEKPHLYHISSGQRKNALIFHVKIGIYCYELYLSNVLKNSCLFSCRDKYCNAKAKFELKSEFIMREVIPRANGALPRINFTVDRQDPKLRELSNWTVKNYTSQFVHSASCEVDFNSHLRREFRTEQTEKAILIKNRLINQNLETKACVLSEIFCS